MGRAVPEADDGHGNTKELLDPTDQLGPIGRASVPGDDLEDV
ncbi:hypothetical protein [Rubrivirga sp.]